jgi:phosphoglycolate phosphatase
MVRAAIFDLDGTLVDSLDDIAAALASALAEHGLAIPTTDEIKSWIGDGARSLVVRATSGVPSDVDRVLVSFGEHYRARPVGSTRAYDGIEPVLDRLDAAGIALAVLSNKPHDLTAAIVARLFPHRFAEIAGQRPNGPLKPAPAAGLSIAAALGVDATQCVMIGDSAVDVATARACDMQAIAVTWGLRPRDELESARPDHIVDEPVQLLSLLL